MIEELKLKQRFFALYWGQNVWCNSYYKCLEIETEVFKTEHLKSNTYLELKSLEDISDEDAISVSKIIYDENSYKGKDLDKFVNNPENGIAWLDGVLLGYCFVKFDKISNVIDYLRSRGYAVPFLEFSVEDLINKGWIKF